MNRLFVVLLIFSVPALIGYGGKGPSWAAGDEALRTGIDAYVYAYPLVLMDVTRLYIEKTTGAKNVLLRGRVLSKRDSNASVAPEDSFLVSAAWLDLSKEPVILHIPDFGSRPSSAELSDGWTHVVATLGNGPRDFAVAGPRWMGEPPPGITVVRSPTDMALIQVRVFSGGTVKDIVAVYALQDQISLTPLSSYGKPDGAPIIRPTPAATSMEPPSEQVADMDAKTFFTYFTGLLISNPPRAADAAMMAKLASVGIVPGPNFDFDKLDPAIKYGISQSVGRAQIRIQSFSAIDDPNPGAYYLSKARSALLLATNLPVDPVR